MMENSKQELEHLLSLLKTEQEEDRKQYKDKMLNNPLVIRRAQGLTWYPVIIRESYYGVGERLILELERPSHTEIHHQFQFGKVASLFSNYNNEGTDNPSISGVVTSVRPNNIKLTLFVDELPDWVDNGKLGVDLLFDESSYKEMENAINQVMKAKHNRVAELREILLGFEPAKFTTLKNPVTIPSLNESQNKAVNNILTAEDIAIVHGPPGTGKTTTIVQAIKQVVALEKQTLVCAPSNTAVDLLTEKLNEQGLNVLRIGHPARVSEFQLAHTLDAKIAAHKEYKTIKELKKRSVEFRNMALKYKRHFGREERNQRKAIMDESRKLQQEAAKIEEYIVEDLISKADVITCTLVGSTAFVLKDLNFKTVFIDEAAQALEPATWIPILRAQKVVLAGDHFQLPPTVKSVKTAREGLNVTLFEKAISRQKADVMLEMQYRMNEKIMNFSGKQFYKGLLKADPMVKDWILDIENELINTPVEFIDTAGCSFEEQLNKESSSTYNPAEADLLLKHLGLLFEALENTGKNILDYRVGIISPYKAQVELLKEKIKELPFMETMGKNIAVNTVDGFQGQERDIIYISLVRSNSSSEIGFLADIRRMNVALTRAKKKLVIIGDSATLGGHPFYKEFLNYTDSINAYKSAWEFL